MRRPKLWFRFKTRVRVIVYDGFIIAVILVLLPLVLLAHLLSYILPARQLSGEKFDGPTVEEEYE